MAQVTDKNEVSSEITKEKSMSSDAPGTTIGQEGWSGHSLCGYKIRFASLAAGLGVFGFCSVSARDLYVLTMRSDASHFAWLYILTNLLGYPIAAMIGYIQNAETLQPMFTKLGCKREEWGRHAPHVYICLFFGCLGILTVWNQPDPVTLALTPDDSSYTTGNATLIAAYKSSFGSLPTDGQTGLDCSKPITFSTLNTTVWGKNGHAVCENLISEISYCWPFPQENARKCVYPNSIFNGWWWFFGFGLCMASLTGILNLYQAASNEIYPWKAERVQVFAMQLFIILPVVMIGAILFALMQNYNELSGAPEGGSTLRWISSLVLCLLASLVLLSITPLKEARQPAKDGSKHISLSQYWTLLFPTAKMIADDAKAIADAPEVKNADGVVVKRLTITERAVAIRWIFVMWMMHSCWNTTYTALNTPYIYYVLKTDPNTRGTFNGLMGVLTILSALFTNCCLGFYYGRRNETRKKLGNKNPQTFVVITNFICAAWGILGFLTVSRPNTTSKYLPGPGSLVFIFVYASCYLFHVPYNFFFPIARGWVMDEDVQYGDGVRREALVSGLLNMAFNGGFVFAGIITVVMYNEQADGKRTCDSRLDSINISTECQNFIQNMYMVVLPIIKFIIVFAVYKFPIKGARLENLYEMQGATQLALKGTLAERTVVKNVQAVKVQQIMKVTLPDGAVPGMELEYPLSDGRKVKVVVKEGQKGGDEVSVNL